MYSVLHILPSANASTAATVPTIVIVGDYAIEGTTVHHNGQMVTLTAAAAAQAITSDFAHRVSKYGFASLS